MVQYLRMSLVDLEKFDMTRHEFYGFGLSIIVFGLNLC